MSGMKTYTGSVTVPMLLLVAALFPLCPGRAQGGEVSAIAVYVSPTGDDGGPGTLAAPFRTLTRARDAVRQAKKSSTGPVTVFLRGGTHYLADPLTLDGDDSGEEGSPVVYRG